MIKFKPHKYGNFKVRGELRLYPNVGIDGKIYDSTTNRSVTFYNIGRDFNIPFDWKVGCIAEIKFVVVDIPVIYKGMLRFKKGDVAGVYLNTNQYKIHKINLIS